MRESVSCCKHWSPRKSRRCACAARTSSCQSLTTVAPMLAHAAVSVFFSSLLTPDMHTTSGTRSITKVVCPSQSDRHRLGPRLGANLLVAAGFEIVDAALGFEILNRQLLRRVDRRLSVSARQRSFAKNDVGGALLPADAEFGLICEREMPRTELFLSPLEIRMRHMRRGERAGLCHKSKRSLRRVCRAAPNAVPHALTSAHRQMATTRLRLLPLLPLLQRRHSRQMRPMRRTSSIF